MLGKDHAKASLGRTVRTWPAYGRHRCDYPVKWDVLFSELRCYSKALLPLPGIGQAWNKRMYSMYHSTINDELRQVEYEYAESSTNYFQHLSNVLLFCCQYNNSIDNAKQHLEH